MKSQNRVSRFSFIWRGLTLQLFLVTILPLTALLLVITFGSLRLHQNAMRMMVGERDARSVILAARALEAPIEERLHTLQGLAGEAAGSPVDVLPQVLAAAGAMSDDFDGGLALWSRDGLLRAWQGDPLSWQQIGPLVAGNFVGLSGHQDLQGGAFYFSLDENSRLAIFSASPGSEWVAAGIISLDGLFDRTLQESFSAEMHTTVLVVDGAGNLIYQSGHPPEGLPAEHAGVAEALRGEQGTLYVQTDAGEHVVAYSPVNPPGWAIVVEEPWEMVSTPVLSNTQLAPLVLVPVLLLAVLALGFGLRQVVQPLQALEARSGELAWGNFEAIQEPVGGIDEIQSLQAELIHLANKVQAAQSGLRGYIGAMTAAQEDERRRLARELHDDTLQSLIALKQRLQLAQLTPAGGVPVQSLKEIEDLSEQTIQNLRRLTRALRPIYLEDVGLAPALEMLARESSASMGIPVAFEATGQAMRLEPATELALYRLAQEALNNVARHARASRAAVKIDFQPGLVELCVSDDGQGFVVPRSPAEFAPGGHFGLLGMHERAELVRARLKIESTPGHGTSVLVRVPVADVQA